MQKLWAVCRQTVVLLPLFAAASALAAPVPVKDVNPGALASEVSQNVFGSSIIQTKFLALGNGKAVALLQSGGQLALYVTDGTAAGTSKLIDVPSTSAIDSVPHVLNGYVYFWLGDAPGAGPVANAQLWRSNGTAGGTGVFMLENGTTFENGLLDIGASIARLGNKLIFAAATSDGGNREVWVTDGTSLGTETLSPYCNDGYGDPTFSDFDTDSLNGYQYFGTIDCTSNGTQLWRTDGTDAGTSRVADIYDGSRVVPLMYFKQAGNQIFFRGTNELGTELWVSDGTELGTHIVADLNFDSADSRPTPLQSIGDKVLFSATTAALSREYWVSDGSEEGTLPLTQFGNASNAGYLGWPTAMNGAVYFVATSNNGTSHKLMRTDGTVAGTSLVREFASIEQLTAIASGLYFGAQPLTGGTGMELWQSDGSAAQTKIVADIFTGSPSSNPHSLAKLADNTLLFMADNGSTGHEPWLYDISTGPAVPTPVNSSDGGGGGGGSMSLFSLLLGLGLLWPKRHQR